MAAEIVKTKMMEAFKTRIGEIKNFEIDENDFHRNFFFSFETQNAK